MSGRGGLPSARVGSVRLLGQDQLTLAGDAQTVVGAHVVNADFAGVAEQGLTEEGPGRWRTGVCCVGAGHWRGGIAAETVGGRVPGCRRSLGRRLVHDVAAIYMRVA